ncbi:hypothetical protein DM02DRAFT_602933, partial [Periconia macrospinosa]
MVARDVTGAPWPNRNIDEAAEIARPKPLTLREPRLVAKKADFDIEKSTASTPECHPAYGIKTDEESATNATSKHESFLLSGSVFLVTNCGKTLSLPIPSDSKLDPLNWSRWRTGGAMLAIGWFSVASLTTVQAASVMLGGIRDEFRQMVSFPFGMPVYGWLLDPWSLESLVTAPTLFMGIGAFLWVPLTALLCMLARYGPRFLCNFGSSTSHALPSFTSLMVIDMTFIDQRPKAIAAFWSITGFIGIIALSPVPLLSGDGKEWHLFYQTWSPVAGAALVLAYFLYPETYFKRPTVAFNGLILLQTATEKLTIYEDLEADSDLNKDLPGYP